MALELFRPFVAKRLVDLELAQNIKSAKRMVERRRPCGVGRWRRSSRSPVLPDRALTLHRPASRPRADPGRGQGHPDPSGVPPSTPTSTVTRWPCTAAVGQAQAEAALMLSANNILSPASGRPIVTPQQDIITGG
jgi:DNA-directed RNA polymerase subunit beta'